MRVLMATFVAFTVVSFSPMAWSQSVDPFGQRQRVSPDDPFNRSATPSSNSKRATPAGRAKAVKRIVQSPKTIAQRHMVVRDKMLLLSGGTQAIVRVQQARQLDAEQVIHAALDSKTTQTFIETPLSEAIQTLSAAHDIAIVIDHRALDEIGLDSGVGVNLDLKNVSLRAFLDLMLRDLDLTYIVKDEVLQVTTAEAAENNLVLEMYVLPKNLVAKSDQVIKVLTATVVPETWESLGGPSTAMAIDHVLVVSTTDNVHHRVKKFLTMLSEKYGE